MARARLVGELATVDEAAERLGVTPRRVQALSAEGQLRRVAAGLIDRASPEQYLTVHSRHTRAWAEPTAWAAIALPLMTARRSGWPRTISVSTATSEERRDDLVRGHALVADDGGSITIRATTMAPSIVSNPRLCEVITALGLAESARSRERRIGREALDRVLRRHA